MSYEKNPNTNGIGTHISRSGLGHSTLLIPIAVAAMATATMTPAKADAVSSAAAAIAQEVAKEALDRLPRALPLIKRAWERRKDKKRSVIETLHIVPLDKNRAFVDVSGKCGFRTDTKKGRRRYKWLKVYYFDKELYSELRYVNEKSASRIIKDRVTIKNLISENDLAEALKAGLEKLPVLIRVSAKCETYDEKKGKFRGKHPDTPAKEIRFDVPLTEAKKKFDEKIAELFRKADMPKRAGSSKNKPIRSQNISRFGTGKPAR